MSAGAGRLPTFLIIGAQKSGTTSLGAYLDAHPAASCVMEPHFFCCHFDRGVDWYRRQFTSEVAAIGEKTPEYLHSPEAPERMARVVRDAKLIAILRDPVGRAYSHYWHRRRTGRERSSFEDAIASELDGKVAEGAGYLERGRYLGQLERVRAAFPREALLVVLFEDLRDAPAQTFAEVCRFIGIDDRIPPANLGATENPYRVYRPEWLWNAMYRYRLWRRLPSPWAAALGRWMTREDQYHPMEAGTRRELARLFAEDNQALGDWLGRDLSVWTSPGM